MKLKALFSNPVYVLIAIFIARLATLQFPALIDTTDARYASISANMAIDNNSIVPYVHQDGEMMGYWSKPPLAFWSQAGAIQIFGLNEWAARFPGFLWLALTAALTAWLAKRWLGEGNALLAALLTASTSLIFILAAVTMTDQPLVAALTGAMIGFGIFFETLNPWAARVGFACLGLSLLAKGPIGLMIPGASLGAFVLFSNSWGKLLRIPWGSGLMLMLAVAAPWYLAMERAQPGFLHYFLMDENFNRLFSGNLLLRHGTAHPTFRGAGLLCFIIVTIPWIFFLPSIIKAVGWRELLPRRAAESVSALRELYLLCWFAAPLLPFAVGKQVLPYYLLPLAPGFVLWLITVSQRTGLLRPRLLTLTAAISTLVICIAMVIVGPLFLDRARSTRPIIEAAVERIGDADATLAFADRIPDSGYFYLASPISKNLRFVSIPLDKLNAATDFKWVILRKKDLNLDQLPSFKESLHLKKWVLLERKS